MFVFGRKSGEHTEKAKHRREDNISFLPQQAEMDRKGIITLFRVTDIVSSYSYHPIRSFWTLEKK